MKRSTWALVATGSVAVAALLAWAFAPRPVPVSVARASIGAFETAIEEEGRTRVRERHVAAGGNRCCFGGGGGGRRLQPRISLSSGSLPLGREC